MERIHITEAGLEKLKEEINFLKKTKRVEIAERVQVAREHGDLKENAEYHAAKEELERCQSKINDLEVKLMNVLVINEDDIPTDKVYLLATVKLVDINNNEEMTYTIVPESDADWENNKLSVQSPIAKGLLGKAVGDTAKIEVPAGIMEYKVIEITRDS